ncbi:MAG TPA: G8 domain-containing protein, partial [Planctomycetaceae bacterium]|nr:G8 domain-containing protein [Planctomycetaceae bacterium]
PKIWEPSRVPQAGDRVLVSRDTVVEYDSKSEAVIRLVQVVGTLRFSRDRDTELNVGVLKVQSSDDCSESGFACDFEGVNLAGEPIQARTGTLPTLEVGTLDRPIPPEFTARIRLHHLPGFDEKDAPALVCCSARMELHGAPLSRTWVKLGQDVQAADTAIVLSEDVSGWKVGDEVIVTGSKRADHRRSYRNEQNAVRTEERTITKIEGRTLQLDKPLKFAHYGSGEFRSEVANLSRSVIVESADPEGVRGHTLYHAYSQGGISYTRLAHLGKENLLGRYAIHFHLVGDTMRGSQVLGAAIVDSHNRWITVHGTEYLLVRDCIGYKSVGHGYFMEDGTEVFNLFDRNLGVQAYRGKRLPEQVLPFDPNDGGAFWWSNGRNTLVRNVACENDEYGYRYDCQKRSNFDSNLGVRMADGKTEVVDIRTLPIHRFSHNESHTEGLYGYAFAGTDGVGPDTRHPHQLSDLKAWEVHYALRAQIPTMSIERVQIDHAAYGIYRPWFENHAYRDLHIASTGTEPFNRGLDDESLQHGRLTVDGLTFSGIGYGGQMPLIQISANNVSGTAESHFRGVKVE